MTGPLIATTGVPFSVMVPVPRIGAGLSGVDAARVRVSAGSPIASIRVGTRTMKLVAPAGTSTVLPVRGAKLVPLSNETSAAPVSTPSVALPEAGVRVTVVGVVLGFESTTAKSRLPPSAVLGLETETMRGRSSSVPPLPPPLSRIVPRPMATAMLALTEALRLTLKVSAPS